MQAWVVGVYARLVRASRLHAEHAIPTDRFAAVEWQDVQRIWRMVCGVLHRRVRSVDELPGVAVLLGASTSVASREVQWASILSRLLELVGG
jgi:hypothetical protein